MGRALVCVASAGRGSKQAAAEMRVMRACLTTAGLHRQARSCGLRPAVNAVRRPDGFLASSLPVCNLPQDPFHKTLTCSLRYSSSDWVDR